MVDGARAKVFWTGRSQAVRLPKDFRIDATEVRISRRGSALVLEPVPDDWSWLEDVMGERDESFERALRDEMPAQDRPSLDEL